MRNVVSKISQSLSFGLRHNVYLAVRTVYGTRQVSFTIAKTDLNYIIFKILAYCIKETVPP